MLTLHRSLSLALGACGAVLAIAPAATAASIEVVGTTFSGDPSEVQVDLTELGGDIVVDLKVVGVNHGDLRAFYMNVADPSLVGGLSVQGAHVTEFETHTFNLGDNTNLKNNGGPCPCDIGVELGTPGSKQDDLTEASFTISHATVDLQLSQFMGQVFGIEVGSVGPKQCFDGASAVRGEIPAQVPEPSSGLLVALGASLFGLARRSRGSLSL
jgi:PEP-CTERM motif-containing protein